MHELPHRDALKLKIFIGELILFSFLGKAYVFPYFLNYCPDPDRVF